jgi:hypothetical protein
MASGQSLLGATPALAAGPPPFALASPAGPATSGDNADFEGPHVFEEEEQDSEVFSDLEF